MWEEYAMFWNVFCELSPSISKRTVHNSSFLLINCHQPRQTFFFRMLPGFQLYQANKLFHQIKNKISMFVWTVTLTPSETWYDDSTILALIILPWNITTALLYWCHNLKKEFLPIDIQPLLHPFSPLKIAWHSSVKSPRKISLSVFYCPFHSIFLIDILAT